MSKTLSRANRDKCCSTNAPLRGSDVFFNCPKTSKKGKKHDKPFNHVFTIQRAWDLFPTAAILFMGIDVFLFKPYPTNAMYLFHHTSIWMKRSVASLDLFGTMAADHFHFRVIVNVMFGQVEGKSRFTSKAISLKCGQRLACKDIFAKLAHPLSTHRARNQSSSFAEFFHTEATKRVTAWGSHLR